MTDPRIQTDSPHEPLFEDGAFHIEASCDDSWCVYDSYQGRAFLYFATDTEAIDACVALSEAAASGDHDALDAAYEKQLTKARASLAEAGIAAA